MRRARRRENALSLVLPRALRARHRRPGRSPARAASTTTASATRARRSRFGPLPRVVELRATPSRELAVGVSAVHALRPGDRLAACSAARRSPSSSARTGTRDRRGAAGRRHAPRGLAGAGRGPRAGGSALYSNSLLIVMAHDLARVVVRRSRSPAGPSTTPTSSTHDEPAVELARLRRLGRTSGRRRCRTGSRSSWPSARWRSSRSTCASAARRSPSRSARRTRRRASRAEASPT